MHHANDLLLDGAIVERIADLYRVGWDDAVALIRADPGEGSIRLGSRWLTPPTDVHLCLLLEERTGCSGEVAQWAVHRLRGRLPLRTPPEAWHGSRSLTPGRVRLVGRRPGDYFLLANAAGWSRVYHGPSGHLHFLITLSEAIVRHEWYAPWLCETDAAAILREAESALARRGPERLDRVRLRRSVDGFRRARPASSSATSIAMGRSEEARPSWH